MSQERTAPARLVSQLLLEDADLRDLVSEFVSGLSRRIEQLQEAHVRLDFDQLALLTHRLKGAAGSYGYPEISQICADMERHFRNREVTAFDAWASRLQELVAAARAGLHGGGPADS